MSKHHSGHSCQEFPIPSVVGRCGLALNDRMPEWEGAEAFCPLCGDYGPGKCHLFLNTIRNIFRCVLCGEKSNSVPLYAKMGGILNRRVLWVSPEDSVPYQLPQQLLP